MAPGPMRMPFDLEGISRHESRPLVCTRSAYFIVKEIIKYSHVYNSNFKAVYVQLQRLDLEVISQASQKGKERLSGMLVLCLSGLFKALPLLFLLMEM
jgi:hypothetical protein